MCVFSSPLFLCSCRRLPCEECKPVHPEEDETRGPLGSAGAAAGGDGTSLLGRHPAPPFLCLALFPSCSIHSSSAPALLGYDIRESDARRFKKSFSVGGMKLNFLNSSQSLGGYASFPLKHFGTFALQLVLLSMSKTLFISLRGPEMDPLHGGSQLAWTAVCHGCSPAPI